MEILLKTLSGSSRSSTYSEASGAGRDGAIKKVSFLLHVIGKEEIYNRFHRSDVIS